MRLQCAALVAQHVTGIVQIVASHASGQVRTGFQAPGDGLPTGMFGHVSHTVAALLTPILQPTPTTAMWATGSIIVHELPSLSMHKVTMAPQPSILANEP